MAIDLNGSTGISLDDNEKINLGNSDDLQIYHDGSASYIDDAGTGNLKIRASNMELLDASGNDYITMVDGGSGGTVRIKHLGATKLTTTSTGVDVTGADNSVTTKIINTTGANYLQITNGTANGYFGTTGSNTVSMMSIGTHPLTFGVDGGSEKMRIDSSGNVGIGTSSPLGNVTIANPAGANAPTSVTAANTYLQLGSDDFGPSNNGKFMIGFGYTDATNTNAPAYLGYEEVSNSGDTYGDLTFYTRNVTTDTAPSERVRIDSSGNLLVGKMTVGVANVGAEFRDGVSDYSVTGVSSSQAAALFGRNTTDGDIIRLRKDNVNVGSIGVNGGNLYIAGNSTNNFGLFLDGSGLLSSNNSGVLQDNVYDVGHPSYRWDDIYATNGTIQTSDFNEKQDIASLTATEMLVGARISALFKTFRWKDSVAEKGDNARTHTGVIAQDVQAAFTAEGLDAGDYALFISSTWWEHDVDVPAVEAVAEVTDEDGNVTTEAVEAVDAYTRTDTYDTEAEAPEGATSKTRMGIRYPELLSFVAAYNEQRFASIEARLTALEA